MEHGSVAQQRARHRPRAQAATLTLGRVIACCVERVYLLSPLSRASAGFCDFQVFRLNPVVAAACRLGLERPTASEMKPRLLITPCDPGVRAAIARIFFGRILLATDPPSLSPTSRIATFILAFSCERFRLHLRSRRLWDARCCCLHSSGTKIRRSSSQTPSERRTRAERHISPPGPSSLTLIGFVLLVPTSSITLQRTTARHSTARCCTREERRFQAPKRRQSAPPDCCRRCRANPAETACKPMSRGRRHRFRLMPRSMGATSALASCVAAPSTCRETPRPYWQPSPTILARGPPPPSSASVTMSPPN